MLGRCLGEVLGAALASAAAQEDLVAHLRLLWPSRLVALEVARGLPAKGALRVLTRAVATSLGLLEPLLVHPPSSNGFLVAVLGGLVGEEGGVVLDGELLVDDVVVGRFALRAVTANAMRRHVHRLLAPALPSAGLGRRPIGGLLS